MKREFLQLAQTFDPSRHGIGGWFSSQKLDGQRCFWDGGISRGQPKAAVPWANTAKDARYVAEPIATGLWSRYGNVIHAPDWFLDKLPRIPLDGELYTGKPRQDIMSIIKKIVPGDEWKIIKYHVFDAVPLAILLEPGRIDNVNFKKNITPLAYGWANMMSSGLECTALPTSGFETRLAKLRKLVENECFHIVEQTQLPFSTAEAMARAEDQLDMVVSAGGEGLIVRAPHALYECCRTHAMLKIKAMEDAEATVTGYISGRATDKGSKLRGMMGALITSYQGKRLELSGFTDDERSMRVVGDLSEASAIQAFDWCFENPGMEVPMKYENPYFPRGTLVTFKYRGFSKDGIPQEGRYWRVRDER